MERTWRLGYRPALDGLRAIAVLLVIADHAHLPGFAGGGTMGVTLFFVLSGFLITSLLVAERESTGWVNLAAFYRRRAVRLLPALALMLVIVVPVLAVAGDHLALLKGAAVALYSGNWLLAGGMQLGPLNHTWSLAIEEQFYLAWPLLLLPLMGRRAAIVAIALAAAIIAWRVFLASNGAIWERLWAGSDVRADALLVGCALALLAVRVRSGLLWLPVVCGLLLVSALDHYHPLALIVGLPLAAAVGGLAVVMAYRGARWLDPLAPIGRIAYGLYLWNLPSAYLARAWFGDTFSIPAAALQIALTFAMAIASWHLVERPAQRRWRSAPSMPDAPASPIQATLPTGRTA